MGGNRPEMPVGFIYVAVYATRKGGTGKGGSLLVALPGSKTNRFAGLQPRVRSGWWVGFASGRGALGRAGGGKERWGGLGAWGQLWG